MMKYMADSYVKLSGRKVIPAPLTQKPYDEILNDSCLKNGVAVVFEQHIPKEAIDAVQKAFGDVYRESGDQYIITIADTICVYSQSKTGLIFGAFALKRHLNDGIPRGIIYNTPNQAFRAVKVYLPGKEDFPFFKEFVQLLCHYGYNKLIIETGGAMEYKKHPEINREWIKYCDTFREYQGKSVDYQESFPFSKNSIHCENGRGSWLTQHEIKELIDYCERYGIEIIPEVPSFSHSDYLLLAHKELAERAEDPTPDTYCPSNPKSYELLFDILDETINLFKPKMIHIGHDEVYSIGLCDKCKGKDPARLYADDITKIYTFLKERNVETMIWGDQLLNAIAKDGRTWGGSLQIIVDEKTGRLKHVVPAIHPSIDMVPKDIVIMNWYWGVIGDSDKLFHDKGFRQVLGNFNPPDFEHFEKRKANFSGFSISNWSVMNKEHIQRNGVFMFMAYGALMAWNPHFCEADFRTNCYQAAADLYYTRATSFKGIEITHTATVFNEHPSFVDGFEIDKAQDYLGEYSLLFEDGSETRVPIYYGINIGNCKRDWLHTESQQFDGIYSSPQLFETGGTCLYREENNLFYYTFFIPCEGKIKKVALINSDKLAPCVLIKEINARDDIRKA